MAVISYYVKLNGGGSSAQNQFNHIMLHEGGGGEAGESDAKNQVPPSVSINHFLLVLEMIEIAM